MMIFDWIGLALPSVPERVTTEEKGDVGEQATRPAIIRRMLPMLPVFPRLVALL